jgi:pantothenate synthetase
VDYVACFEEVGLQRPARATAGNILATAVKLGSTRLIDNVVLGAGSD